MTAAVVGQKRSLWYVAQPLEIMVTQKTHTHTFNGPLSRITQISR